MTCNRRKRVVLATWMKSQITSETPKTVTIRNGCSGWVHPHWRGVFYPEKLAVKSCLPFCADHFETAEGNNSFYRIPRIESSTLGATRCRRASITPSRPEAERSVIVGHIPACA